MAQPNPSRVRRAASIAAFVALLATLCAAGALAQSGRKAQKPLGLPTESPKSGDPAAAKPAETKKVEAAVTFLVMKYDNPTIGIDSLARDGVAGAFFERLKRAGSVDVKDAGRGRRQEARERAKSEATGYVVLFQLEEEGGMSSAGNVDSRGLILRTYVYTPKTGDLKYADTMYQRPYQDTARIGGVRVPVPSRRTDRYPSQHQLEQAARDIADRLLSRFQITPPPEN